MKTKSAKVTIKDITGQHPKCNWRVYYPSGDKRLSKFFAKETDALEFKAKQEKELGTYGTKFAGVTDSEQSAVMLWRSVVDQGAGDGVAVPGLLELVQSQAKAWRTGKLGVTVDKAFDEFMANMEAEEASKRHLDSLRGRVGRFVSDHPGRGIGSFDESAIVKWLQGLRSKTGKKGKASLTTRDNHRRSLHSFFEFAGKWIDANPVPKLRKVKTKAAKIAGTAKRGILMPWEAKEFFEALASVRTLKSGSEKAGDAKYHDHDHVSYWALKAFAGLRDSEAVAIDWRHIDLAAGKIAVPKEIDKNGEGRDVEIQPNLDAWLRPRAKKRGPVAPQSEMTRRYALKKTLAILRKPDEDGKPRKFTLPHNWARHGMASYHLYHFRNAGETAMQLGHQGKPAMLHAHYKNRDAEEHAADWWEIRPPKPAGNVVKFKGRKAG